MGRSELDELMGVGPRSTFVTVVAWVSIVMFGLATVCSVLFGYSYVLQLSFVWVSFYAMTFVFSIGLLRRRHWARGYLITAMYMTIAMQLLSLPFVLLSLDLENSSAMFNMGWSFFTDNAEKDRLNFRTQLQQIFAVTFVIGTTLLQVWVIKKLKSPKVKKEFGDA